MAIRKIFLWYIKTSDTVWAKLKWVFETVPIINRNKAQIYRKFYPEIIGVFEAAVGTTDNYNYFDCPLNKTRIQFNLVIVLTEYAPQNPKWIEFQASKPLNIFVA